MKKFACWLLAIIILLGGYFAYSNLNKQDTAPTSSSEPTTKISDDSSSSSNHKSKNIDDFTPIANITENMEGSDVKISGYVASISGGKGHTFCTVKDPNSDAGIKVVLFKSDSEADPNRKNTLETSYNNKSIITIEGKVDIYQGELEVIAKKVY